jgi:hypothetical protein
VRAHPARCHCQRAKTWPVELAAPLNRERRPLRSSGLLDEVDITLADLRMEAFLPADATTAAVLIARAAGTVGRYARDEAGHAGRRSDLGRRR